MGFKDTAMNFGKKLKLDSHHAIERFGIMFGVMSLAGVIVLAGTGASAFQSGRELLSGTALYNTTFTTSKTELDGTVEGVYTNELDNVALVVMKFAENAQISYNAEDYEAFLLGSTPSLKSEPVASEGIDSSLYVFGSTGYMGVLLKAEQPFERQVLNLTMRSNSELTAAVPPKPGAQVDELAADESFAMFDQWRVFFNPGASDAEHIKALDAPVFDPARAFYDVVLSEEEGAARNALDEQLLSMRASLAQINAYSTDLQTTKVDGVFLRPPVVPKEIRDDVVTGETASEAVDKKPNLKLETKHVLPGGFDFDWRSGNIYDGYLTDLVPSGGSYASYLAAKAVEDGGSVNQEINSMSWVLNDGTDLTRDYSASDVTMRPLKNVMNNLSQAYLSYAQAKTKYQGGLMLDLLNLDVELRNVQSNSSTHGGEDFITIF